MKPEFEALEQAAKAEADANAALGPWRNAVENDTDAHSKLIAWDNAKNDLMDVVRGDTVLAMLLALSQAQSRAEKAEAERDALLAEITRIKAIPTLCDDCPAKMLRKQP